FLFHWAGASAAAKIGRYFGRPGLVERANKLRDEAVQRLEQCYDESAQAYAAGVDGRYFDASLFQLLTMQYLDPRSERAKKHLKHLAEVLAADGDGIFYRYDHADDFGKPEVAFLVCGFW